MDIAWDYEEPVSQYHIYIYKGPLDAADNDTDFCLHLPQTKENDEDIESIVKLLQRISDRSGELG